MEGLVNIVRQLSGIPVGVIDDAAVADLLAARRQAFASVRVEWLSSSMGSLNVWGSVDVDAVGLTDAAGDPAAASVDADGIVIPDEPVSGTPAWEASGFGYDTHAAAADVCEAAANKLDASGDGFDFSTDGQSFSRSQTPAGLREAARRLRQGQLARRARIIRSDSGPEVRADQRRVRGRR